MRFLLLATTFFLVILCNGQIVNVESSRMQSDTTGWMGSVGAAASFTKNTENIFQANLEVHVQYKTKNDQGLWLILGDLGFLKIGDTRFGSDGLRAGCR